SSFPREPLPIDPSNASTNSETAPVVFRGSADEHTSATFMSDFAEATHDLLMDDSPARRAEAAIRLARLGKPLACPYLIASLSDASSEVCRAAAQSLGLIGDSSAIAPLEELLA